MFWFGFLVGAAASAVFILYGDGDLLIRMGEQMKRAAARFWAWQREKSH